MLKFMDKNRKKIMYGMAIVSLIEVILFNRPKN